MKKKRVLFIVLPYVVEHIDVNRPKLRSFAAHPYGVLSIATYCKDLADFYIIDCNAYENYKDVITGCLYHMDWCVDIVGFSMMFDNSYPALKDLLELVNGLLPIYIPKILGGAAASYSYEEILKENPDLDAICFSEGEKPMHKLLHDLEYSDVLDIFHSNTWLTHDTIDHKVAVTDTVSYLDQLIPIDYSFINPDDYGMQQAFSPFIDYSKPHKQFFISTSRGCPHICAFCSNAALHGKKVRMADPEVIYNHCKYLVDEYGMDVLTIYDDQLLLDMNRAKEIFRLLAPLKLRIECPNGLSIRYIDQEMADLMFAAGMDTVYLALESGSPYVLEKLIHKPLKLDMVEPCIKYLRNAGDFFVHAFIVLGMPGETEEHRWETFHFLEDHDFDWAGINLATPVRGSQLYKDCIDNGWIKKYGIGEYEDKIYIINHPDTDPKKVQTMMNIINYDHNFHCNRRMSLGDYKTAAATFQEVLRRYGDHIWAKHYLAECERKMNNE